MVSLLDIAPATEKVSVAGGDVDVFALSAKELAAIMARFPALNQLFAGRQPGLAEVMKMAPEAIAAVIAAGTGHMDENDHEKAAGKIGLELQTEFIAAILRCTLPRGTGPFVERLKAMGFISMASSKVVVQSGKGQDMKSQKQSSD